MNWLNETVELTYFALLGYVVALLLALMLLAATTRLLSNAHTIAMEAADLSKLERAAAEEWQRLAHYCADSARATMITGAALDGYDIEVTSFDANDRRAAKTLLTDLHKTGEDMRRLKADKGKRVIAVVPVNPAD